MYRRLQSVHDLIKLLTEYVSLVHCFVYSMLNLLGQLNYLISFIYLFNYLYLIDDDCRR